MYTLKIITLALLLVILSVAVSLAPIFSPVANAGENAKYRLTVNATPSDSRIRVMNIKPKYRHGIALKPGKYDIKVTRSGYESKRWWVEIKDADITVDVTLSQLGAKELPKKNYPNGSNTDNIALWQYALQLRKTKPDLFAGAQGVLLLKIETNSQAEKNGLRRGDIVIAYAGQPINSVGQLGSIVQANATKRKIKLRFIRANTVKTVKVRGGQIGIQLSTSINFFSLLEWFETEFLTALQAQDNEKLNQLFIDNPHLVEQYQRLLTRIVDKGTKEDAEWARNVTKVVEEIFQTLYLPPSYIVVIQLLKEGTKASISADYSTALEKLQSGLKQAQKLEHQYYISEFLRNIGVVHTKLGQYQKALEYHELALIITRNIDYMSGFGNTLFLIGGVYKDWGQYPKALEYLQQALVIKRGIGDKFMESTCLTSLGIIYRDLGSYEKALEYLQQALVIDRAFDDKRSEGSDLSDIATVYHGLSQYQKSIDYLEQALKIRRNLDDKSGELSNLSDLGGVYQDLGEFQKSLDYLQQAMKIAYDIDDKRDMGNILNKIGNVYKGWQQYQKALDYFQKALAISRQLNPRQVDNKKRKAIALSNIGVVYLKLEKSQKALDYLQQALAIDQEIPDIAGIGADLMNIGGVYMVLAQNQKALDYFQQSLEIMRDINNKHGEANNLANIAGVYRNWGQYQKALDYYQQALAIHQKIDSKHEIEKDLSNIRDIRNQLNMPLYDNTFGQKAEDNRNINIGGGIRTPYNDKEISKKNIAKVVGGLVAWLIIIGAIIAMIGLIIKVNNRKKQASEIATEVKQKFGKK